MIKNEVWKDVVDYEGYYQVSNKGRVMSLSLRNGRKVIKRNKILNQTLNTKGYLKTNFSVENKIKTIRTHRIVGITFIPNLLNKPEINHINGIKTDNRVENLEWVTHQENCEHSYANSLNKRARKVNQIKNGVIINTFRSQYEASKEIGVSQASISNCCNKIKGNDMIKGYKWQFAE